MPASPLRGAFSALLLLASATAQAANLGNVLKSPGIMSSGQVMYSRNKIFELTIRPFGVLCIERIVGTEKHVVWAAGGGGTSLEPVYNLEMQKDGNLCLYEMKPSKRLIWQSDSPRIIDNPFMILQDDGNLCVYGSWRGRQGTLWCRFR